MRKQPAITDQAQRPLRCMFVITSMPVGGAEVLLVNLIRSLDRNKIEPQICCLKEADELGEQIQSEVPVYSNLIGHRYDVAVVRRLKKLFVDQQIDAVVTVGAGDKMFWGRLAARYASVSVVLSALHSTGWPDGVGRLNRLLTRITDGFIAVADQHRNYLIEHEGFPEQKVFLIRNGIDTSRFRHSPDGRRRWRKQLGIAEDVPVIGIVAALRQEKNHPLFIQLANECFKRFPQCHYIIVGDGPERSALEQLAAELPVSSHLHFTGTCNDIPQILSAMDVFALTSHNEASPVSILEAMSCQLPVVAPAVGSISQAVLDTQTGYLFNSGDLSTAKDRWLKLIGDADLRHEMGERGQKHVLQYGSLDSMTQGYTDLIHRLYAEKQKTGAPQTGVPQTGAPQKFANANIQTTSDSVDVKS